VEALLECDEEEERVKEAKNTGKDLSVMELAIECKAVKGEERPNNLPTGLSTDRTLPNLGLFSGTNLGLLHGSLPNAGRPSGAPLPIDMLFPVTPPGAVLPPVAPLPGGEIFPGGWTPTLAPGISPSLQREFNILRPIGSGAHQPTTSSSNAVPSDTQPRNLLETLLNVAKSTAQGELLSRALLQSNANGRTALLHALDRGLIDQAALLISVAEVNLKESVVQQVCDAVITETSEDKSKKAERSALFLAVEKGGSRLVEVCGWERPHHHSTRAADGCTRA